LRCLKSIVNLRYTWSTAMRQQHDAQAPCSRLPIGLRTNRSRGRSMDRRPRIDRVASIAHDAIQSQTREVRSGSASASPQPDATVDAGQARKGVARRAAETGAPAT
jgi:hypothetical protein